MWQEDKKQVLMTMMKITTTALKSYMTLCIAVTEPIKTLQSEPCLQPCFTDPD